MLDQPIDLSAFSYRGFDVDIIDDFNLTIRTQDLREADMEALKRNDIEWAWSLSKATIPSPLIKNIFEVKNDNGNN